MKIYDDVLVRRRHIQTITNLSTLLSSLAALYGRVDMEAARQFLETADAGDDVIGAETSRAIMVRSRLALLKRSMEQVEEQIHRLVHSMPM